MLDLPAAQLAAALEEVDWDFADRDTGHSAHALQPYPAKFPPQIPEALILLLSEHNELVLDCFGGCGTTALEAIRHGRVAYSIDANPVATLLTRVKTADTDDRINSTLDNILTTISKIGEDGLVRRGKKAWRPEIPNVERWYAPHVVDELAGLRELLLDWQNHGVAFDLAMTAFANVASRMSFQDSETRYKSVPRVVPLGQAAQRLSSEINRLVKSLSERQDFSGRSIVIDGDARTADSYPDNDSVGLAVSSPPYPNAYDYHLYHRFRIYWLGQDPKELRRVEVGSHLINQTVKDPILRYERDMTMVLSNVFRCLRPGRFAAFVVGDGIHGGVIYDTASTLERLAGIVGFESVTSISRALPELRRSVTVAGRRLVHESVVVLRKPLPDANRGRLPPPYPLFPYEEVLAEAEIEALTVPVGSLSLRGPHQAAFSYVVAHGEKVIASLQAASEYDNGGSQRKNSTYGGHGLHAYKGKFYPQLAKALINITNPYDLPGVVLDPFGGSGTVAMECRLAGLNAVSMDINPVAVAIACAKSAFLDVAPDELRRTVETVLTGTNGARRIDWVQFSEDCHEELDSWFPTRVLVKLSRLLAVIRAASQKCGNPEGVDGILRAVVSDLIREVSQQDPSDLRIRRRALPIDDAPVFEMFASRTERLLLRHRNLQFRLDLGPELGAATIVQGNAAEDGPFKETIDRSGGIAAVVSSPPYGVALPYLDTDRLSLAAVYGISKGQRGPLERELIGSREISTRDRNSWEALLSDPGEVCLPDSTLAFVDRLYNAVTQDSQAGFRRQQTPAVLLRYFTLMSSVLGQVVERLNPEAKVALVVGDSRTTVGGETWTIPTVDELVQIAHLHEFELVSDTPITVTRESRKNAHNAITDNRIIIFAH